MRPLSAEAPVAPGPGVRWIGAQRDVPGGDLRGYAEIGTLSAVPHLYGLGPLEGLRGAVVSIFDSVPSIARIEPEMVVTAAIWRASLLPGLGAGAGLLRAIGPS